jgi:hypothetical protein
MIIQSKQKQDGKKSVKLKKCRMCQTEFSQRSSMQVVCSIKCSIDYSRIQDQKKRERDSKLQRKMTKAKKEKLKTRSDWLKEAQVQFNAYIRMRDKHKPCVSCKRFHEGKYDAGHYRTVKSQSGLRFHTLNVHKQCQPCNRHLSANMVEYRKSLKAMLGDDMLDFLERDHDVLRLDIDGIKRLKDLYKRKTKLYANRFRKHY